MRSSNERCRKERDRSHWSFPRILSYPETPLEDDETLGMPCQSKTPNKDSISAAQGSDITNMVKWDLPCDDNRALGVSVLIKSCIVVFHQNCSLAAIPLEIFQRLGHQVPRFLLRSDMKFSHSPFHGS